MDKLNIPIAIVITGIIIAGAIIFTKNPTQQPVDQSGGHAAAAVSLAPITESDHLLGNRDADIIIVEYSDTECPFCNRFHKTMNQIMEEFGRDGKVAWVYRHFPLDSIHPKARTESQALECAGELGGNEGFWRYTNRLFEITPSNNQLDLALLPEIAEEVGLDRSAFLTCLESNSYANHIQEDLQSGLDAGVRGTPASFVLLRDGTVIPLPDGAQPFNVVKSFIERNL